MRSKPLRFVPLDPLTLRSSGPFNFSLWPMKKTSLSIALFFSTQVLASDDLYFGPAVKRVDKLITIDMAYIESLRDGKNPDAVWASTNEIEYLAGAHYSVAKEVLFNTLLTVIDNKETVVDCGVAHPKYNIKYLLEPLSDDADIWTFLAKTDKATCYKVQSFYVNNPASYRSEYDNPKEADICGILFKQP